MKKVLASKDEYFTYDRPSGRSVQKYGIDMYNDDTKYLKFQISPIHPYDDADYTWARCGYIGGNLVQFIFKGKVVDRMQLWSYDEEDYEDEDEYIREVIDAVCTELNHFNADVEPRMVHN